MSSDDQNALLYTEFVQGLLYLNSVDDIQQAIREMRNLDSAALYHEFDTLEQTYVSAGSSAQRKLLLFVRNIIDEVIQSQAPESSEPISTADQLIQQALRAPDMVHVYTLLRNHRQLLDEKTYQMLQLRTSSKTE